MKPFQLILLSVFGVLALGGLLLFATFKGFGSSAVKVGTVVVWGTLPQSAMEIELSALKGKDQAYGGVSYIEKPEQNFDANLAEALASNTGPDLILVSHEHLLAERSKISEIPFSSISERTYLDTYAPISELYLTTTGTYGIPFLIDPLVLYYNRTILSSAGYVGAPSYWESVTGLSEKLSQRNGSTVTRSMIPFGTYENMPGARAALSLLLMQSGNSITKNTTSGLRSTISEVGARGEVSPAESAVSFYTQFSDPAKTVYSWNESLPSAEQAFSSGDLVLYPGFASELSTIKATNPNLDFDVAAIPQPQTSSNRQTYGLVYAFSIPKSSGNAAGALAAAFALSEANNTIPVATALGMAPATRSGLSRQGADKYTPIIYPQALVARGWLSPGPEITDRIFSTMIRSITSGRAEISGALQTANQALSSAL
jgi:ABC-type glycerol-3-phosphate transport system substrate-binding protein